MTLLQSEGDKAKVDLDGLKDGGLAHLAILGEFVQ